MDTRIDRRKRVTFILILLLLSTGIYSAQAEGSKLKVVAEQANIRSLPDISSEILFLVPRGAIFTSLEKSGEWYQVEYIKDTAEKITGFVHESLVAELEPPVEKPGEQQVPPVKVEPPPPTPPPKPVPIPAKKQLPRPTAQPGPTSVPLFNIYLSGGVNYVRGGALNTGATGLSDYYAAYLASDRQGEIRPVDFGLIFGGEIRFPLAGGLSIGLGADYLQGKKASSVTFSGIPTAAELRTDPEIKALPIRFILAYAFIPQLYLKAGIEYYFASCSYYYRFSQGESWQEWEGQADARDLGALAALGFVGRLYRNLSFFLEITGRYAKLSNFEGTGVYRTGSGIEAEEKGSLYLYSAQAAPERFFPLLFIRDRKPSEAGVSDPFLATIDLSGISLQLGIKISF